jgi:archaellum biogenesis protein FlaJ (TadC family)
MPAGAHLAVTIARSIGGMIAGYGIFVIGTIVARLPFEPLSYGQSSAPKLLVAALVVPWSGALGGIVTAMIVPMRPILHIIPAMFLIALESSWFYITGRVDGPLWFEVGAALSLILGFPIGAALWSYAKRHWRWPGANPGF